MGWNSQNDSLTSKTHQCLSLSAEKCFDVTERSTPESTSCLDIPNCFHPQINELLLCPTALNCQIQQNLTFIFPPMSPLNQILSWSKKPCLQWLNLVKCAPQMHCFPVSHCFASVSTSNLCFNFLQLSYQKIQYYHLFLRQQLFTIIILAHFQLLKNKSSTQWVRFIKVCLPIKKFRRPRILKSKTFHHQVLANLP